MNDLLRAPFSYHGGKGKKAVLEIAWAAMGSDVPTYIEPFGGSLAVLLGRPGGPGKYEVVGDINGLLVNAWRSIKLQPGPTARFCDWPPTELDLAARSRLLKQWAGLVESLIADSNHCDPQLGAYWLWCQSVAFSTNWLDAPAPAMHKPHRRGILSPESDPEARFAALAERLARVAIAHGDWTRLVTPSALGFHNTGTTPTAVFLDPVYIDESLDYGAPDPDVAHKVADWCREFGGDPRLRIVFAGHTDDYDLPGWRCINWGGSRGWGRKNRGDNEALWLSPHCQSLECLQLNQLSLGLEEAS